MSISKLYEVCIKTSIAIYMNQTLKKTLRYKNC